MQVSYFKRTETGHQKLLPSHGIVVVSTESWQYTANACDEFAIKVTDTGGFVKYAEKSTVLTPTCPKLTRPGCDMLPGCPMAALSSTFSMRQAVMDENSYRHNTVHARFTQLHRRSVMKNSMVEHEQSRNVRM